MITNEPDSKERICLTVDRRVFMAARRAYPFLTTKQLATVAFERMVSDPIVFKAIPHDGANAA